jgi:DNA-directed RNA polymerase II subunit RPB2
MNDWGIVDAFFKENPYHITKHHLDSYDSFITHDIPRVIKSLNRNFSISASDNKNKLKHKIEIFVGGEKGDAIHFDHPTLTRDGESRSMLPNDARINDLTYAINLKADVDVIHYNYDKRGQTTHLKDVKIGRIPLMLHSNMCILRDKSAELLSEMGECMYDQGGYFIIDGKEKCVVSQERNITNQIFITKSKDPIYSYDAFIRSTVETESVFPKTTMFKVLKDKNAITVEVPHLNFKVPLFMLFRALGIEDDKSILQYIVQGSDLNSEENRLIVNFMYPSIVAGNLLHTKEETLNFLKDFTEYKTTANVEYILWKNLFPNVEGEDEYGNVVHFQKALFLGHVTKKLAKVALEIDPITDRDNYMYKRLAVSGFLFAEIFKDFYNSYRKSILKRLQHMYNYGNWKQKNVLDKSITENNKHEVFIHKIIDDGFLTSLKGQWGLERLQNGIVQDLNRFNFTSYISSMKKVSSPLDPRRATRDAHQLNCSQHGIMCPIQTPEGEEIGLSKTMSMACHVTHFQSSKPVIDDYIMPIFGEHIIMLNNILHGDRLDRNWIKILTNNTWIGCLTNDTLTPQIIELLHLLKQNGFLTYISISWNIPMREIYILTEHGRTSRPLFVVDENNKLRIKNKPGHVGNFYGAVNGDNKTSWEDLKKMGRVEMMKKLRTTAGSIEYVDVQQTNYSMIAMYASQLENSKTIKYTHCEIHPSFMLSPYTSIIPFSNHNHSPRNVFSAGQGKWSIGRYATNYDSRMDTIAYILHYPQARLVQTRFSKHMHDNEMPIGENLMVALACFSGYNQEDSVILNKSSVERGMFNITMFKTYKSEEEENDNVRIVFGNPYEYEANGHKVNIKKYANYETLDENGFPKENTYLQNKDSIIGKVKIVEDRDAAMMNMMGDQEMKATYTSETEILDKTIEGYVDKVYVRENYSTGMRNAKIRLRKMKLPELGDKVASTHGQKGVCGMLVPQESMPFTANGVVPDIIVNPHAFPSRMTIGHLLEAIVAKSAVHEGIIADGTPFEDISTDAYQDALEKNGVEKHGLEIMYDGNTGQQIDAEIFFTPTYYYRLKHMVSDKINYRNGSKIGGGKVDGLTLQPTQGRANEGGLRIGEMEVNVLYAHGMAGFAKESLSERSDGKVFQLDDKKEAITNIPNSWSSIQIPNSFKLLTQELQTMGVGHKINI